MRSSGQGEFFFGGGGGGGGGGGAKVLVGRHGYLPGGIWP